jgi:hypothetical protein
MHIFHETKKLKKILDMAAPAGDGYPPNSLVAIGIPN